MSIPSGIQCLRRLFGDGEIDEAAVVKQYLIAVSDGKDYQVLHYSFTAIIAVGFKVKNERAVQFRKWANRVVKEYTIKRFFLTVQNKLRGAVQRIAVWQQVLREPSYGFAADLESAG